MSASKTEAINIGPRERRKRRVMSIVALTVGVSLAFLLVVLQAQTTLLAARASELQAQTDLNKSISQLQHATGNTLEANNVAVIKDTKDAPARDLRMREPEASEPAVSGNAFAPAQAPGDKP